MSDRSSSSSAGKTAQVLPESNGLQSTEGIPQLSEKVDPTPTTAPAKAPGPPSDIPNGGFLAWYQVMGSFFLFFNCWGVVNTFGVYQTYYEQNLLKTRSAMDISWVGSIQAFLLVFVGVVTGPLYDYGYFRVLIGVGSILVVFGMMMTSICHEYWEVMLAQGIVVGLGSGCLFVPSVAILPTYFSTKKALAQGIAASGSSLGGVIYPIVFRKLQPQIGFGWATRVIAFIMLATLIIPNAGMRMRVKPSSRRRMFEAEAWREPPFVLFSLATFFGFMGMYMPFFYVQSYAMDNKIMDENLAFYLLSITNAASVFGRIVPNFFADKTGPLNMLLPTSTIAGVLAFVWIGIHNTGGMIVFCILYGFFSGTFVSLPPTTIVTLSPSLGVVGVRMGMSFVLAAIGLLIGTPIGGALLDHGWVALQAWCGACVIIAALLVLLARLTKVGTTVMVKA